MARRSARRSAGAVGDILADVKSIVTDPKLVAMRRKQITTASLEVFRKLGFHIATIRDVAEAANVSVGLIYQYVGDKEDLLYLALVEILASYQRDIPAVIDRANSPLERFYAAVRAYCQVHDSNTDAIVLAYRETASLSKERRDILKQLELDTNELIAQRVRECADAGVFFAEVDYEMFTYQIVMMCHTWALKAWYFSSRMTLEAYVDRGLKVLLGGVLTTKGERAYRRLAAKPDL